MSRLTTATCSPSLCPSPAEKQSSRTIRNCRSLSHSRPHSESICGCPYSCPYPCPYLPPVAVTLPPQPHSCRIFGASALSVSMHQHQKGVACEAWAERRKMLWRVEVRSLGSCCVICIVSGRCVNVTLCGQLSDLFTFSIEFASRCAKVEHFNYTGHRSKRQLT